MPREGAGPLAPEGDAARY